MSRLEVGDRCDLVRRGSSRRRRRRGPCGPCRRGRWCRACRPRSCRCAAPAARSDWQSASSTAAGLGERRRHHDRGRRGDAVGQRHARNVERRAAVRGQVQRGGERARAGRGADRRHPRAAVVGRRRTRAAVAGRGVDRDACVERVEERELDRVACTGCAPPEIEKLITLTPSAIACCTADDRVGAEAAAARGRRGTRSRGRPGRYRRPGRARRRRGRPRRRSRRQPSSSCACRGPRSRAASTSRSCCCRTPGRGADVRHVGGGLGVGADQLVVARERRAEMRRRRCRRRTGSP